MRDKKIELLAPAGNFEKLEAAIHFGADAVYLGGKDFSLRSHSGNFTIDEMAAAVSFARRRKVKVYIACNVFARNPEKTKLYHYMDKIGKIAPDGIIIADPGIFMVARQVLDTVAIHVSTQANITSTLSAAFWADQGAARINAARELTIPEIKEIAENVPVEIEAFVHGAMCVAYSGRCLLSHYMAGRDGNRGLCAHACRWKYSLVEEKRPGKYMPVYEDNRGSYFFSARDLCMIDHVPEMIEAGISSLKIEGRMKGLSYLAATVGTYRRAIDAYYDDPVNYRVDENWRRELETINYRGYSTGFYMNDPDGTIPVYEQAKRNGDHRYIGKILRKHGDEKVIIDVKNRLMKGSAVEIIGQTGPARGNTVLRIENGAHVDLPAAQPNTTATLSLEKPDACIAGDIIRIA